MHVLYSYNMHCAGRVHAAQAVANPGLCQGHLTREAATTRALKHAPYFAPACNPRARPLSKLRTSSGCDEGSADAPRLPPRSIVVRRVERCSATVTTGCSLPVVSCWISTRSMTSRVRVTCTPWVLRQVCLSAERGCCSSGLCKHSLEVCRCKGAAFDHAASYTTHTNYRQLSDCKSNECSKPCLHIQHTGRLYFSFLAAPTSHEQLKTIAETSNNSFVADELLFSY